MTCPDIEIAMLIAAGFFGLCLVAAVAWIASQL